MAAKLYVILGSHACRTGMLLLEHKRIPYEAVHVPTGFHPIFVRLLGFPGRRTARRAGGKTTPGLRLADRLGTVPALRLNGQRVQTNREIARFLERIQPDPPLFPADPELRHTVEEAERWGDEVFQMAARRLALTAAVHDDGALVDQADDGRLGTLLWRNRTARRIGMRTVADAFRAGRANDARLLAELPELLDRIDAWIWAGALNGDELYAADYMIAPSLALLSYRPDARAEIEARPAFRLMDRILPEPNGQRVSAASSLSA
jgi:glutathione S-transferase